jgi:small subunit ribosomal protein S7
MSRKKVKNKREIPGDPVYNKVLISLFVNRLMKNGKKSLAYSIFYKALDLLKLKTGKDPVQCFDRAVKNSMPLREVRTRRVGGSTYQVPVELPIKRSQSLAIRWLVLYARKRTEKNMVSKLLGEFLDASNDSFKTGSSLGRGGAIKHREGVHKTAEANKAFMHYRW